jgi:hypothetical protein
MRSRSHNGVPVARLVRAEPTTAGSALLAAHGKLAFELSDEEIDAILDEPA